MTQLITIFLGLFFTLSLTAISAFAAEVPQIPSPGEDQVLTQGLSAREFFDRRLSDNECLSNLAAARSSFDEANRRVQELISAAAPTEAFEVAEATLYARKTALIKRVFQCGECAQRPVERREIEGNLGTQVWYVTDGSCSLHGDGAVGRYEKGRNFLKGIRNYPQKLGGLSHVLEFVAVDPQSGEILENLNTTEQSPLDIFISVRSADMNGLLNSISYFFRSTSGEKVSGDRKEYSIQFTSKRPTPGFRRPEVYFLPAAGKVAGQYDAQKRRATQWNLRNVKGSWYLSSDGYVRYFTAADFGELIENSFGLAELFLSEKNAAEVLGETLFDLSEISRGAR